MKAKLLLLTQLTILFPLASWADLWQDPETNVYYEYTIGSGIATVNSGNSSAHQPGSPLYTKGGIKILDHFVVDGKDYLVTSIGEYAFYGCWNLTSVEIPNSVTSIGEGAFSDCIGLISVEIPNSVTSIGDFAFCECSGLSSVTISNSVTSIGESAFESCRSLTSFVIPNGVTSIGESAFRYCMDLISVTISNSVTSIGASAFYSCRNLASVTIPNSVTSIGEYAFRGCWNLTSVEIPNSVKSIGGSAFAGCIGLTSVEIPNSVTSIGERVFEQCSGLISVTIPNSVTSIGEGAFSDCSGLKSVEIPNSVTSIGLNAFWGCSGLKSVEIPNSVTSIEEGTFAGCIALTSIEIPNSVTNIGVGTFADCTGLTSVEIPNSVTSIGERAFAGCSGLTSVEIPNSVTSIGGSAFRYCSGLTSVTSLIMDPFYIRYDVFSDSTYDNAILYVPNGKKDVYEKTGGWENFKTILPLNTGFTTTLITIDENGSDLTDQVHVTWYDTNGKQIGTGSNLNGIEEGTELYYSVTFGEELGRVYREVNMQKMVVENETATCQLKKIGRVQLEGRVSATDIDKATMTVNIKQMLNGKWEQTYTAQTNEQGVFKVEVYDDVTDITISADGYFDATLHRDGLGGNGNVGVIPMSLISGFSIAANISVQKAVAEGENEEMTTWTDGLNNIDFTLTNTTKGVAITDFTVQNGNVIIKSSAGVGDNITLVAKSKQGVFADATMTFTIAEGTNAFDLQLTELGGFDATCAVSNNGCTSGYLYNNNDVLVAKGSYVGETLSLRHLKSGVYTLVSMGNSSLLGSMTRLSDLSAVGLTAGTDYVSTRIEIVDGELAAVNVSEVPQMDERKFYYTSNSTYFNANKSSVTAGNYLTLQAYVHFKPEYTDKVDDVTLTIDLPEGCEMVENSVIANRQAVVHTITGNQVSMSLSKDQWQSQVRFCIIPTLNQKYTITAMAHFDIDGQITQPIGTAQFETKGLSLSVLEKTSNTNIIINGTAKGHSGVSIYDNEVFIGKTTSKADGSWTAECELYKPYSHSYHDIYAKIITENGMELNSVTRQLEYDKNALVPEKVTMIYYNGWYKEDKTVVFNLLNGTSSSASWPFYSATDFTFLADFTRNDSTVIKNVNIKVLNSDGTVRTLPATFDSKRNCWVATTKYSNSYRLPQNVKVEYDLIPISQIYDEEMEIAMTTLINNMLAEVENAYKDCSVELINADENSISFTATTNYYDTKENFKISILDYDQVKAQYIDELYCQIINDTTDISFIINNYDDYSSSIVIWDNKKKAACEISTDDAAHSNMSRPRRIIPFILTAVYGVGTAVFEYNLRMEEFVSWRKTLESEIDNRRNHYDKMLQLLYSKCPDGSYKIKDDNRLSALQQEVNQYSSSTQQYLYDFENAIDRQQQRLQQLCSLKGIANVALSAGGLMLKGVGTAVANASGWVCNTLTRMLFQGANTALTEVSSQAISQVIGPQEAVGNTPEEIISKWYFCRSKQLTNDYISLIQSIKGSYSDCKKKEEKEEEEEDEEQGEDNDDIRGEGSIPYIDPSGYVYEAVLSNRLEGVTATCYQKVQVEDMYGDISEEAVIWNAEDYSQVNPQLTDKTGFYRWDVPQGMWQVKYEKEGYEMAYSDWLPVPPPQLDVNIGMKQSTPPTVKQMRGFESGIHIEMAKYMRPETMTTQTITVTRNGSTEKGNIEFLNAEKAPLGDETYVSKVKFVPQSRFNTTDLVVVTVHKDVESYCGVKMAADHVETVKIEPEIKNIVADSVVTVPYQGSRELRVLVLPKDASVGKTLHVNSSSSMIASVSATDIAVDQDGTATLTLGGELPGGAVLDFSIDGSDVTATSKVKVVIDRELVAMPVANIRSGEVIASGTQLVLTCSTEGATIYYTLDGSCPCDEATRHRYDGPITITTDVIVKAIAVKDDMDDSDIATFVYFLNSTDISQLESGIRIWPLVTSSSVYIDLKDVNADYISVTNLNGVTVSSVVNATGLVTIDLSKHTDGMYMVNVRSKDDKIVRKIVKVGR